MQTKRHRWLMWERNAPEAAKVALDAALVSLSDHPDDPALQWARCTQPPHNCPPPLALHHVLDWGEAVRRRGRFDRLVRTATDPLVKIQPGKVSLRGGVYHITTPFWMAKTPMYTVAGYVASMISWRDALQICNDLSFQRGLPLCYTFEEKGVHWNTRAAGYRLPTLLEWQLAAHPLPTPRELQEGNAAFDGNLPGDRRLEHRQGPGYRSRNGLEDLWGLVEEWVWDSPVFASHRSQYPKEHTQYTWHAFYPGAEEGRHSSDLATALGGSWTSTYRRLLQYGTYVTTARMGTVGMRLVRGPASHIREIRAARPP